MSQQTMNWGVSKRIDIQTRSIIVEMGVIDSFGELHVDPELVHQVRDPKWLTIPLQQFIEIAEMELHKPLPTP